MQLGLGGHIYTKTMIYCLLEIQTYKSRILSEKVETHLKQLRTELGKLQSSSFKLFLP